MGCVITFFTRALVMADMMQREAAAAAGDPLRGARDGACVLSRLCGLTNQPTNHGKDDTRPLRPGKSNVLCSARELCEVVTAPLARVFPRRARPQFPVSDRIAFIQTKIARGQKLGRKQVDRLNHHLLLVAEHELNRKRAAKQAKKAASE